MPFLTLSVTGLDAARMRIAVMRAALHTAMVDAMGQVGDAVIADLENRAPVGQGEEDATPPEGDAPGHLRDSFVSTLENDGESHATLTVSTTQPQKLSWVVNGRGWVFPVNKRALYWAALGHPVPYARPSEPNDFVSPVMEHVPEYVESIITPAITAALEE